MKKKRIILGILGLTIAGLTLASCGKSEEGGATTTTPVVTTSGDTTTPDTGSTTTPATDTGSTTTPDTGSTTAPATDETNVPDTGSDTTPDTGSVTPDVTKYTVTFMNGETKVSEVKVEESEAVAASQYPELKDITAPAGKRFEGWVDELDIAADLSSIIDDTVVYASFVDVDKYDEFANATSNIMATTFYNETLNVVSTDGPYKDFTFKATTPIILAKNTGAKINSSNKLELKTTDVLFDLGGATASKTGIYQIYFEMSFKAFQGEAFFQIDGSSADKTDTEVFALRTSSSKFNYRFDGGTDVALGSNNSAATNTKYQFMVELNTAEGKISVYRNDFTTPIISNVATSISKVNGIKFTCKPAGSSQKIIDNVAINFTEQTKSPVAIAKEGALALIDAYKEKDAYKNLNEKIKADVDKKIETFKVQINNADSVEDVNALKGQWETFESAGKYVITINPLTRANINANADAKYVVAYEGPANSNYMSITSVEFNGFDVEGFYTDSALTNAISNTTEYTADTTVYAKVKVASIDGTWDAANEALGQGSIADGTKLVTICSTTGAVVAKYNGDSTSCIGFEFSKKETGKLVIDVPNGREVSVTLVLKSTSGTNETESVALKDSTGTVVNAYSFTPDAADTTSANDNGTMKIYGTAGVEVVYHLSAGTYSLSTAMENRGFRVTSIEVGESK